MGTTLNGIYIPDDGENSWGTQVSNNLRRQSENHANVKAYGAVGNGVADDTTAINSAIAAATNTGGPGVVYFPAGSYAVTSAISLDFANRQGVHLIGTGSANGGDKITSSIIGNFSGPLVQRTAAGVGDTAVVIEGFNFGNTHVSGECVSLQKVMAASTIANCRMSAYRALSLKDNTFGVTVRNCYFPGFGSFPADGYAIYAGGHTNLHSIDINGYETGIRVSHAGFSLVGARIEVCKTGIMLGKLYDGTNWLAEGVEIGGVTFEANDTGINLFQLRGASLHGLNIFGTAASPSGGSLVGIDIGNNIIATALRGIRVTGSHATNSIRQTGSAFALSLSSIETTNSWSLTSARGLSITGCSSNNGATTYDNNASAAVHASLPAATGYAAGAQFYCTTDKQPLWSDGASWYEADGTVH